MFPTGSTVGPAFVASDSELTTFELADAVVDGFRACLTAVAVPETPSQERYNAVAALDDAMGANPAWVLQAAIELIPLLGSEVSEATASALLKQTVVLFDAAPSAARDTDGVRRAVNNLFSHVNNNDTLLTVALPLVPKVLSHAAIHSTVASHLMGRVAGLCCDMKRSYGVRTAALKTLANFDFVLGAISPYSVRARVIFAAIAVCLRTPAPETLPWSSYHCTGAYQGTLARPQTGGFHPDGSKIEDPPEALLVDAAADAAYTLAGSTAAENAREEWSSADTNFSEELQVAWIGACRWRYEASESLGSLFAQQGHIVANKFQPQRLFELVSDPAIPARLRANNLWALSASVELHSGSPDWEQLCKNIIDIVLNLTADMMDVSFVTPFEFNKSEEENTAADSFDTLIKSNGDDMPAIDPNLIVAPFLNAIDSRAKSEDPIERCAALKLVMYGLEGLTSLLFTKSNIHIGDAIAKLVAQHLDPDHEPFPAARLFALRALSEVPVRYTDQLLYPTLKCVQCEIAASHAGEERTILLAMSLEILAHLLHRCSHQAGYIDLDRPTLLTRDSDDDNDDDDDEEEKADTVADKDEDDDEWEDEDGSEGHSDSSSANLSASSEDLGENVAADEKANKAAAKRGQRSIVVIAETLVDGLINGPLKSTHAVVLVQAMDTLSALLRCPNLPQAAVMKGVGFALQYLNSSARPVVREDEPVALRNLIGGERTVTYQPTEQFAFLRDDIDNNALAACLCSIHAFFAKRSQTNEAEAEFRALVVQPTIAALRRLSREGRLDTGTKLGATAIDVWNVILQVCRDPKTENGNSVGKYLSSVLGYAMHAASCHIDSNYVPLDTLTLFERTHPDTETQTVVEEGVRREVGISYRVPLAINTRDRAIAMLRCVVGAIHPRLLLSHLYDFQSAASEYLKITLDINGISVDDDDYVTLLRGGIDDIDTVADCFEAIAATITTSLRIKPLEKHVLLALLASRPITASNAYAQAQVWCRVTDYGLFVRTTKQWSDMRADFVTDRGIALIHRICDKYNAQFQAVVEDEDDEGEVEENPCEFTVSYAADYLGALVRLYGVGTALEVVRCILSPLGEYPEGRFNVPPGRFSQMYRCATMNTASALVTNLDPRWPTEQLLMIIDACMVEVKRAMRRASLTLKERNAICKKAKPKAAAKPSKKRGAAAAGSAQSTDVLEAYYVDLTDWDEQDIAGEARTSFATLAALTRRVRGADAAVRNRVHQHGTDVYGLLTAFFRRTDIKNEGVWWPTYANACTALTALGGGHLAAPFSPPPMESPPGWTPSARNTDVIETVDEYDFDFAIGMLGRHAPFIGDGDELNRTQQEIGNWFVGRHERAHAALQANAKAGAQSRASVDTLYAVVKDTLSDDERATVVAWLPQASK